MIILGKKTFLESVSCLSRNLAKLSRFLVELTRLRPISLLRCDTFELSFYLLFVLIKKM